MELAHHSWLVDNFVRFCRDQGFAEIECASSDILKYLFKYSIT